MTALDLGNPKPGDCVVCELVCSSPISEDAYDDNLEGSVEAHVPGPILRSTDSKEAHELQLPKCHTLNLSKRKQDSFFPITSQTTQALTARGRRLRQRNAHKGTLEIAPAKKDNGSTRDKQRGATSACTTPRMPSTDEALHEEPPHKRINLSPEAGSNKGQAPRVPSPRLEATTHTPSPANSPHPELERTEIATKENYSGSKVTDPLPAPCAIVIQSTLTPCSPMLPSLSSPGTPPEPPRLPSAATMSSPVTNSDAVYHVLEETLISDEIRPQSPRRYVTAPELLSQTLPSTNAQPSLRLPVDKDAQLPEPPWGQPLETVTSHSFARAPTKHDTHFWHNIPRLDRQEPPKGPSLPEAPAVRFPWPASPTPLPSQTTKPPLPMTPLVWAQSRQELCESLDYFRSYQGGVYSQKKRARGYLLDGHPSAHDLWYADGRVIISHAGGNAAVDKTTGQTILINDQTEFSPSCAALISSYKAKQAIALIAGSKYYLFPYDLHHYSYVVLGYYLITHAWEEPERSSMSPRGYFIRWKFLFQWIEEQGQPWWTSSRESRNASSAPHFSLAPQSGASGEVHWKTCPTCGSSGPTIYLFGWVCTHSTCQSFFGRADKGTNSAHGYHPAFLAPKRETSQFQGILSSLNVRPRLPVNTTQQQFQDTMSRHFWKGWWCFKCGRLSCRERWTYWECPNCQNKLEIPPRPYTAKSLAFTRAAQPFDIGKNMGITTETKVFTEGNGFSHKYYSFHLPFRRGVIHHIQGNRRANVGADSIFMQYQDDAKDPNFFRRYSMKTHKLKGRMLSHYFSQNSGETYKYVGGTDNTVPLDRYSSVKQAVSLIRERASHILGSDPMFNEILSAAYMADQKMEFHSDGEKDLGPIVASLSLGSPAVMRFRPVPSKYIIPESFGTIGRKTPPMALTLTLQHGDVLVMEGAEIQEFYQHAVHPCGFRIAATARYIRTIPLATHEQGVALGAPGELHSLGGRGEVR